MTLLTLSGRPTVTFDVKNPAHRKHYADFLQNRSWRLCPVQFYLERGYGDISSMIENKLSGYYLGQEFQNAVPSRSEQWATA